MNISSSKVFHTIFPVLNILTFETIGVHYSVDCSDFFPYMTLFTTKIKVFDLLIA